LISVLVQNGFMRAQRGVARLPLPGRAAPEPWWPLFVVQRAPFAPLSW